jgi:hypothetical protein
MTWPEAGHFLALFLELVYSRSRFPFLSQSFTIYVMEIELGFLATTLIDSAPMCALGPP